MAHMSIVLAQDVSCACECLQGTFQTITGSACVLQAAGKHWPWLCCTRPPMAGNQKKTCMCMFFPKQKKNIHMHVFSFLACCSGRGTVSNHGTRGENILMYVFFSSVMVTCVRLWTCPIIPAHGLHREHHLYLPRWRGPIGPWVCCVPCYCAWGAGLACSWLSARGYQALQGGCCSPLAGRICLPFLRHPISW